ncbi:MAG: hypothetical protein M1419_07255 [Bacteroidetes bacterium]|nr:hypothetical protein [Bacteroidota bacterium]
MSNKYIFVTTEGTTFAPNSDFVDSEFDNLQVLGFSEGGNPDQAFKNFLKENKSYIDSNFDKLICWQLSDDYEKNQRYFHLDVYKSNKSNIKL